MKSLFTFYILLFLTFTSCTLTEKPTFVSIEDINLDKVSTDEITFDAAAIFKNPNSIGGKISSDVINIYLDSVQVGQLFPSDFTVPAKNEFNVPLKGRLSASKILKKNNGDFLSNILSIIKSKKVAITFKGDIQFKKGFLKHTYHVDETNEISIKL